MELLSQYADRIVLFDAGQVLLQGPPRQVFQQAETFQRVGVRLPQVTELVQSLGPRLATETLPLSVAEAQQLIEGGSGDH